MSSWAKETIGKTVKLQGGYAFKSSRFSDSGVPVIRIGNVQNDVIDIDSAVRHESIDISESFTIQLNDILIAMSGATTGKIGVYKHNTLSYLNQRVGKFVITDKRRMSFGYLYQFLRSHRFQFQLNTLTGQSAQPNISSTQIESLAITLPPLPEQKAIAALLSTWDEAIEKTERLIQAKEKQLNGLYQHYFVPESSSNMHWEKVKIGRVLKQRSKKALPSDDRPLFSLTIEDGVTAKTDRYNREALVKDNGSKKYKIVCPNDIVFNPANLRWGAIARDRKSVV